MARNKKVFISTDLPWLVVQAVSSVILLVITASYAILIDLDRIAAVSAVVMFLCFYGAAVSFFQYRQKKERWEKERQAEEQSQILAEK